MFTASDEDSAATGNSIAYDLWFDDPDDSPDAGLELYAGADAMFRVGANGAIEVNSMLDTDADDACAPSTWFCARLTRASRELRPT